MRSIGLSEILRLEMVQDRETWHGKSKNWRKKFEKKIKDTMSCWLRRREEESDKVKLFLLTKTTIRATLKNCCRKVGQ